MEMKMEKTPKPTRVLRMTDVRIKTGLCQSTIHELVNRSVFPKPFKLVPGGRAVGWLESQIDQWISDRKSASNQEAA